MIELIKKVFILKLSDKIKGFINKELVNTFKNYMYEDSSERMLGDFQGWTIESFSVVNRLPESFNPNS